MNITHKIARRLVAVLAVIALCNAMTQPSAQAAGGSGGGSRSTTTTTVVTPVHDKGGLVKNGGSGATAGGGKSSTTTTTPTTTPTPTPTPTPSPLLPAPTPLTPVIYSASGPINGIIPVCTSSYQIAQYYPTLMDMTVNVQVSSLNVPDGTIFYVNIVRSGALYPYTSNAIAVIGGHGSCLKKIFSFPGDTLVGVVNTDASGTPVFAGQ